MVPARSQSNYLVRAGAWVLSVCDGVVVGLVGLV